MPSGAMSDALHLMEVTRPGHGMYVTQLQIKNLRSFKTADLELNVPGGADIEYPNVNVILGGNGLGKTTVLRAVALSVLGPLLSGSSGFVSEGMVRRLPGSRSFSATKSLKLASAVVKARIDTGHAVVRSQKVSLPNEVNMTTTVRPLGTSERLEWNAEPRNAHSLIEEMQFDDADPAFFLVGYGATRRVESSSRVDESARIKSRLRRYERVAGLFEDHIGLMPLSYWLPEFMAKNPGRYTQVINLINDLLPENCRIDPAPVKTYQGYEHVYTMNGMSLPFRLLSDGYKAYIGWIGDMLFHICMGVGRGLKLRELRGVVLVDEIDLHLHPEWQRVVVPTLAKALPHVQFVVTTHSPLVVGSLEAANLFVLFEEEGTTVVKRLPERVRGKSAEQILLSPYFGLESTRATDTAAELADLARRAVRGDRKASMEYLKILSSGDASKEEEEAPASSTRRARTKEATRTARKKSVKS